MAAGPTEQQIAKWIDLTIEVAAGQYGTMLAMIFRKQAGQRVIGSPFSFRFRTC
jgi:hypothetical protein